MKSFSGNFYRHLAIFVWSHWLWIKQERWNLTYFGGKGAILGKGKINLKFAWNHKITFLYLQYNFNTRDYCYHTLSYLQLKKLKYVLTGKTVKLENGKTWPCFQFLQMYWIDLKTSYYNQFSFKSFTFIWLVFTQRKYYLLVMCWFGFNQSNKYIFW